MEMNIQAIVWLVVLVAALVIEVLTLGLTSIWFAGGALIAFGMAIFGTDPVLQVIVFWIVSLLLLICTRKFAMNWLNKDRVKTNAQSLVGLTAVVTETIENLEAHGQVQVKGQYWTARAETDGQRIETGKTVLIKRISGVKLIVQEVE